MSLPRYIVNIEELASLVEEVFDGMKHNKSNLITTGTQKTKGIRLAADKGETSITKVWQPQEDIWITGIKLGISNKDSWKGNKINILLNDDYLFQDVFMKKETDYKTFRVTQKVAAGDTLEIVFESPQEEIEAWLDFDYTDNSDGELIISPKGNLSE